MAEETIIVGDIVSATTGDPIPNASIYFVGSKIGTSSDEHGNFLLRVDLNTKLKLKVSAVGYKSQKYEITPGQYVGMQVQLEEKHELLSELFVLPGTNPALDLIDSVRKHRPAKQTALALDAKKEFFISTAKLRQSDGEDWQKLPAEMEQDFYFLPSSADINIYSPTISIGSLSVLSPLAASGKAYYRYYLRDSLSIDNDKIYIVDFIPKNRYDALLRGYMHVDSATFALRHVECTMSGKVNVNYLSDLSYKAEYKDFQLKETSCRSIFNLSAIKDTVNRFLPTLLVQETQHYTTPQTADTQSELLSIEKQIETDSIVVAPLINPYLLKFAHALVYTFNTGYVPTGSFLDIGHIEQLIQVNDYERLHIGLPFRTNQKMSKYISIEGYVGYGIRDRGVKYKVGLQGMLPTERRNLIGAYVWDRYVLSELDNMDYAQKENTIGFNMLNFNSFFFSSISDINLTTYFEPSARRRRDIRLWWESDWKASSASGSPSVETTLSLQTSNIGYDSPMRTAYSDFRYFNNTSLDAIVRLGWKERTVDIYNIRKHIYSTYPTIFIKGEVGSFCLPGDGMYRMYAGLHLIVKQNINLGIGGTLDYVLRAGMTFGRVPYTLLTVFDGNTSIIYEPMRFSLMNSTQYAADKYMMFFANWNGQGILFNRIWGLRYLKWRELLEMKIAWGGLNRGHYQIGDCMNYSAPSTPYVELGAGIGNIFHIGELYAVFRLTDLHNPQIPWWAIRFRIHFSM